MASHPSNIDNDAEGKLVSGCLYIMVVMDGAPYQRNIDLKTYGNDMELSSVFEKMFNYFTIGNLSFQRFM
jgi:auxin-responsive protein IAA